MTVQAQVYNGFDPRSRTGSDVVHRRVRVLGLVSIHAPARGATLLLVAMVRRVRVSIHAPARGATNIGRAENARKAVSIHAPARGATNPK